MSAAQEHERVVQAQFGPRAQAYVESAVHAGGADLDRLEALAQAATPRRALDLGCGGGHVAYRLARHAAAVTACDLSADMLAAVAATARARGLIPIETVQAPAGRLPFEDAHFDFLGCRFSAHHWGDLDAGLREAHRVLQPGATAVFIDAVSPGTAMLDTHLQGVELLRDPSHVRDYTAGEWCAALARAGFSLRASQSWRLRLEFATWIARMRTASAHVEAIRSLQRAASHETRAYFAIEADGSFMLDALLLETSAAAD
ncbi:MAG TPA: methyltransferase domain-containing protein [Steroidobacteraceae bacterium]|nr:methyltransferase domain-containing protein [Steroidobacteraceae bacterium]